MDDSTDPSTILYAVHHSILKSVQAYEILANVDRSKISSQPPLRPVGGQIFIYAAGFISRNLTKDGYRWTTNGGYHGYPKHNSPRTLVMRYAKSIKTPMNPEKGDPRFRVYIYKLPGPEPSDFMVHYVGDASVAEPMAQGQETAQGFSSSFQRSPIVSGSFQRSPVRSFIRGSDYFHSEPPKPFVRRRLLPAVTTLRNYEFDEMLSAARGPLHEQQPQQQPATTASSPHTLYGNLIVKVLDGLPRNGRSEALSSLLQWIHKYECYPNDNLNETGDVDGVIDGDGE